MEKATVKYWIKLTRTSTNCTHQTKRDLYGSNRMVQLLNSQEMAHLLSVDYVRKVNVELADIARMVST